MRFALTSTNSLEDVAELIWSYVPIPFSVKVTTAQGVEHPINNVTEMFGLTSSIFPPYIKLESNARANHSIKIIEIALGY